MMFSGNKLSIRNRCNSDGLMLHQSGKTNMVVDACP